MISLAVTPSQQPFEMAEQLVAEVIDGLQSKKAMNMSHSDIEDDIANNMLEVARLLFQGHLEARGDGKMGPSIEGSDGEIRTHKRMGEKTLKSIFGEVIEKRIGYGLPGCDSLYPKDAGLNLPEGSYSHGLHKKLAKEACRGSFDEAIASVEEQTGVKIPKRQALAIIKNASNSFDAFYGQDTAQVAKEALEKLPIQVITTDGKGVVMRQEGLREATREKRGKDKPGSSLEIKHKRLSRGEKKNGKRMAQVASTYCIDRFERKPEDIMREYLDANNSHLPLKKEKTNLKKRPKPIGKRVWASLEKDQERVINELFQEALKRDPLKEKEWIGLVDGQPSQLNALQATAKTYNIDLVIIMDIIHVSEYLWKASLAFHEEGSIEREWWVNEKLLKVLQGKASLVGGGIRRSATRQGLTEEERTAIEKCADYLQKNADYLKYDEYLAKGYPIATGIIEGACRHLVKDRMDITGARWGLDGGEAILKLRSLIKSEDFEAYWSFHLQQEYKRNHADKYAHPESLKHKGLKLIKS
jgi:hypothetical protein